MKRSNWWNVIDLKVVVTPETLQCVCGQWWIQYRCVPCQLLICTDWHFTLFFPLYLSSVDLLYIAVLSTQNVERLRMNACLKLQFRGTGSLWLLWHLSFFFKRLTCHFLYPGVNCAWKRWGKPQGAQRNNSLFTGKKVIPWELPQTLWNVNGNMRCPSASISLDGCIRTKKKEKCNQMLKNLTVKTCRCLTEF